MAHRNGISAARGEEVYAAALRLFREKGYHATSMQDIAGAVGLYKGSLYHYIGGKQDLLLQVFDRAMGTLLADVLTKSRECLVRVRIGHHAEEENPRAVMPVFYNSVFRPARGIGLISQ